MKIIQIGAAKSGNYWLYNILQNILNRSGTQYTSYIESQPIHSIAKSWDLSYKEQADIDVLDIEPNQYYYRISSIYRMPIDDIDAYLDQTNHVWSHSAFCGKSRHVFKKFDKIVYLIRDPRDRAISAAKFRYTAYGQKYYAPNESDPESWLDNRFEKLISGWVSHVEGYLQHRKDLNIHVVFYERFLHTFDQEFSNLLNYLDLEVNSKAYESIKEKVQFASMKSENPQHVRKGNSGYWIRSLTDRQKKKAVRFAGPMLKYLGYQLNESSEKEYLPEVPRDVHSPELKKALNHSNRALKIYKMIDFAKRSF